MARHRRRSGFSLVELSIVLVILGLLAGAILSGQTLIHASELRSVGTQHQKLLAATLAFREKYFYLPGDIPNAVDIWGLAGGPDGDSALCGATESTTTATCDGDGNGMIVAPSDGGGPEATRAWQHLANAGLIEGAYTGAYTGGIVGGKDATNSPAGKIANSYWSIYFITSKSGVASFFDGDYNHVFWLSGANNVVAALDPSVPVLNNEDSWNLDVKADDGKPATGKMVTVAPTSATLSDCATDSGAVTSASLNASYKVTETAVKCILLYRQQF